MQTIFSKTILDSLRVVSSPKCDAMAVNRHGRDRRCQFRAKVEINGKKYCRVHANAKGLLSGAS